MKFKVNTYLPVPNMPDVDPVTAADIQNLWYVHTDSGQYIQGYKITALGTVMFNLPKLGSLVHCKGNAGAVINWYENNCKQNEVQK
jgi:hypothetical protein